MSGRLRQTPAELQLNIADAPNGSFVAPRAERAELLAALRTALGALHADIPTTVPCSSDQLRAALVVSVAEQVSSSRTLTHPTSTDVTLVLLPLWLSQVYLRFLQAILDAIGITLTAEDTTVLRSSTAIENDVLLRMEAMLDHAENPAGGS